jgi:hypothetical protein
VSPAATPKTFLVDGAEHVAQQRGDRGARHRSEHHRGRQPRPHLALEQLATLSADEVVHLIAPTLTRYLTADAGELGLPDL